MVQIAALTAVIAILIFIYFNRYLQKRRDDRREEMYQKRQEFLEKTLEANRNKEDNNDAN